MRLRLGLFWRIIFWYFMVLLVVGGVFCVGLNYRLRNTPFQPAHLFSTDRLFEVAFVIAEDLSGHDAEQWNERLEHWSTVYGVDFILMSRAGRIAGPEFPIPEAFRNHRSARPGHEDRRGEYRGGQENPGGAAAQLMADGPRRGTEFFAEFKNGRPPTRLFHRTDDPTRYWGGLAIPIFGEDPPPRRHMLLVVSGSWTGNGIFFDVVPWLLLAAVVVLVSVLLWAPLVRTITRPVVSMTTAAERIAAGDFDVKVDERRRDEIGRLGRAINDMADRLGRLIDGQKRFLGDVAHELASPIARIKLGLGILERKVDDENRQRVGEVLDDADHMSALVDELLSFTRVSAAGGQIRREELRVADLVARVVSREAPGPASVTVDVAADLAVHADDGLLDKALANLLRNGLRYAGDDGPIAIRATASGDRIRLEVSDRGPGVPPATIEQIFEPFFRPEAGRDADSGGVGLGLAIVKSCAVACRGSVSARNLSPRGLAVTLDLPRA